jgi:hypothetical protein
MMGELRTKICNRCGRVVELWSPWANECECGVEYNGSGQELALRSQWGSETGEVFLPGANYDEGYLVDPEGSASVNY